MGICLANVTILAYLHVKSAYKICVNLRFNALLNKRLFH